MSEPVPKRSRYLRQKIPLTDLCPGSQAITVEAYIAFASMEARATTGISVRKLELTDASGEIVMLAALGEETVGKLRNIALRQQYAFHGVRCSLYDGKPALCVNDRDPFQISDTECVGNPQTAEEQCTFREVETIFFNTVPDEKTSVANVMIKVVHVNAHKLTCIDARFVMKQMHLHDEAAAYPWTAQQAYCIHRLSCVRGRLHVWPSCCVETVDRDVWQALCQQA